MLKKESPSCPSCGSMAISIESTSGARKFYKCEGCSAVLEAEGKSRTAKALATGTSIFILLSLAITYYFSHIAFSIYLVVLVFCFCIFEVVFGIKNISKPKVFKLIAKP